MHIGLFTQHTSGATGSAATIIDALVAHRPVDVTIHRYSAPAGLAALLCARELVARAEADHLDCVHLATTGPVAIPALGTAMRLGLPIISFPPPPAISSGLQKAYARMLIRHSCRTLVTSVAAREYLIRAGIPATKIIVWQPGVDSSIFAPCRRSAALRERWGVGDQRPAVMFAGTVSADRGAWLLRSMEVALHRIRPMHRLIVVGDGPARNELEARCPNAIFLGAVSRSDMPAILASADVYLCPHQASSTNLALLEAQASGLPIVAMEGGSACERVSAATAILCSADAHFIVETAALVRTETRRRELGLAAREFAMRQPWAPGLTAVYAEYRTAAEISRVRRHFQPAFIP
jgi:glycosyltransferase involved in cell wall biosynthesis